MYINLLKCEQVFQSLLNGISITVSSKEYSSNYSIIFLMKSCWKELDYFVILDCWKGNSCI